MQAKTKKLTLRAELLSAASRSELRANDFSRLAEDVRSRDVEVVAAALNAVYCAVGRVLHAELRAEFDDETPRAARLRRLLAAREREVRPEFVEELAATQPATEPASEPVAAAPAPAQPEVAPVRSPVSADLDSALRHRFAKVARAGYAWYVHVYEPDDLGNVAFRVELTYGSSNGGSFGFIVPSSDELHPLMRDAADMWDRIELGQPRAFMRIYDGNGYGDRKDRFAGEGRLFDWGPDRVREFIRSSELSVERLRLAMICARRDTSDAAATVTLLHVALHHFPDDAEAALSFAKAQADRLGRAFPCHVSRIARVAREYTPDQFQARLNFVRANAFA